MTKRPSHNKLPSKYVHLYRLTVSTLSQVKEASISNRLYSEEGTPDLFMVRIIL